MKANPDRTTLPQLLNRYRDTATASQDGQLNDEERLTYQLMALEGTPLTLAQTRHLLLSGQLLPTFTRSVAHDRPSQHLTTRPN